MNRQTTYALTMSAAGVFRLSFISSGAALTAGAVLGALAVVLFFAPANIAPGGLSGIAIILNSQIGTPIGLVTLLLNVPLLALGYRMLGGWATVAGAVYVVVLSSLLMDVLVPFFPAAGVTADPLLNAIFGGIISGISGGLVYRVGGTIGGTTIITRIIQQKFGVPISSSTMYIDGAIVGLAGLALGWEAAMYAIIALFVYGAIADYVMEGPSLIRTAIIITDQPEAVSQAIITDLQRGVTGWDGRGMFTQKDHTVLFVTILRPQVNALQQLVLDVDPAAFVVIGQGHVAYGAGFRKAGAMQRLGDRG